MRSHQRHPRSLGAAPAEQGEVDHGGQPVSLLSKEQGESTCEFST